MCQTGHAGSSAPGTTWSRDGAGNITGMQDTGSGNTASFGYDSGDNQLTSLQVTGSSPLSETYSYNANGDRAGMSGTQTATYGYNQANELTSLSQGSTSASYVYNGDGLRMSKMVNGAAEGYVWDEAEGMPLIIEDGSTKFITGPGGFPVEQVDGSGTVSYYLQDQLGSTRGLIDSSGNIVGTYAFDTYGNVESHTGASTPFGYAGQYTDAESGFQYLRARYYDPGTDQFVSMDPLLGQTLQPYGYAAGDPLSWVDPSGEFCAGPAPIPWSGDTFASCTRQTANAIEANLPGHRWPDYLTAGFTYGDPVDLGPIPIPLAIGLSCQLSRSGAFFCTPAAGLGTPGFAPYAGAAWLDAKNPTPCQVDAFISGPEVIGGASPYFGGYSVWGNPPNLRHGQTGGEFIVSPKPSGSLMFGWAFLLHRFPIHW